MGLPRLCSQETRCWASSHSQHPISFSSTTIVCATIAFIVLIGRAYSNSVMSFFLNLTIILYRTVKAFYFLNSPLRHKERSFDQLPDSKPARHILLQMSDRNRVRFGCDLEVFYGEWIVSKSRYSGVCEHLVREMERMHFVVWLLTSSDSKNKSGFEGNSATWCVDYESAQT